LQKQNRTDRVIILVALAILLLAAGLFYFDDWMWGNRHNRGESIGVITQRTGDVRVKFEGDLRWSKPASGQDLVYNDSIYSGQDSQAQLKLGQSDMTVTENTLVVLRRETNVNFMNLAYGTLFGRIAKSDKVVIDTGEGKPIELSSKTGTSIVVRRNPGGKTELEIRSGEVDMLINGKKQHIGQNTRISVADNKIEHVNLQLVKPLASDIAYSEDPGQLEFAWKWANGRKPGIAEKYTLEFSNSPGFETLAAKREVTGALSSTVHAQESLSLFYRVRGPGGELSSPEKVNFVRMHKPLIIRPVAGAQFETPSYASAKVGLEFGKSPRSTVWFQISNDPKFESVLSVDSTEEPKTERELPPGEYYLRAKADYGNNNESSWTDPVPFLVNHTKEGLRLLTEGIPTKVLIPNASYPQYLYKTDEKRVREFLSEHGFLRRFFPFPNDSFDQINMKFDGERELATQNDGRWPKEKLKPGHYSYSYQITRKGYDPTKWSENRTLEIQDEPPRLSGEPQWKPANKNGESEVQWKFTPLLFAAKYDVQTAKNANMISPKEWQVSQAEATTTVKGMAYWRARARDVRGHVISEWSYVHKLSAPIAPEIPQVRQPAAVENTTTTQVERVREEPYIKNGWWLWGGAGDNFVDYRQSNNSVGSITDHNIKGTSGYVEVGFIGRNNIGGLVTASETPGTLAPTLPAGHTIDRTNYDWTSVTAEGMIRKVSRFNIFGSPIVYGLTLGVQQHHVPFAFIDDNLNIQLKYLSTTNASAGLLAEWTRRRWTYYWQMRYQYPLAATADGGAQFSMTPVFIFDGSIGGAYNITRQLKAGMFWNGQWHQFNFVYSDGTVTNSGFQSLFYSNLNFRLGYDF